MLTMAAYLSRFPAKTRTETLNSYALHLAKYNWIPFSEVETRITWFTTRLPGPIAR